MPSSTIAVEIYRVIPRNSTQLYYTIGSVKSTLRSTDPPKLSEGVILCDFNDSKDDQNALYSEIDPYSVNKTNSLTPQYETLYSESTMFRSTDTQYENSIPGKLANEQGWINDRMKERTTSEATYELPKNLENGADNCYSTLGPTDYSTLEPHIPRVKQQQLPQANDQYSQLQHL